MSKKNKSGILKKKKKYILKYFYLREKEFYQQTAEEIFPQENKIEIFPLLSIHFIVNKL